MDFLDVGSRVWTDYPRVQVRKKKLVRPRHAVVFDTETLPGAGMGLMFLTYTYVRLDYLDAKVVVTPLLAGIAYADDLPDRDPVGYRVLVDYASTRAPGFVDLRYGVRSASPAFEFLSASDFSRKWIYQTCYQGVGPDGPAMLVGFNLPFDLAGLAIKSGRARGPRSAGAAGRDRSGSGRFFGGFSLSMWLTENGKEGRYPRIKIKTLDSKRALISFGGSSFRNAKTGSVVSNNFSGYFLDLRTFAYALKDESMSLRSAAERFGLAVTKDEAAGFGLITPEFVDYAVRDTEVTARLLEATMTEFVQHPIELNPWDLYSPASQAKGYLRAMGVTPILDRAEANHVLMGRAMAGYVGGRAEAHITRIPVPIALYDFTSMYPTVNALLGLWQGHIHDRIDVVDVTEEVRDLLEGFTADDVLDPDVWTRLSCFVEVIPDGAVLPVRARYGADSTYNVGINHLDDDRPRWMPLPDVMAAYLLSETRPRVLSAVRLQPTGQLLATLASVDLRGVVKVDPAGRDFYVAVIEERKRIDGSDPATGKFLKCLASSGSYGVSAQFNPQDLPKDQTRPVSVYSGTDVLAATVTKPEQPGEYCYPPYAALITSGARLLLALLEHLVAADRGTYAFMDTDSIAIVASPDGGPIPGSPTIHALSYSQADAIAERFDALSPYDHALVPHLLCRESDPGEHALVISAKRYARFHPPGDDGVVRIVDARIDSDDETEEAARLELVKATEHGLGYLLAPLVQEPGESAADFAQRRGSWIHEVWRTLLYAMYGIPVVEPAWWDAPTPMSMSVSSPDLLDRFATYNAGRPGGERIRPFGFILVISGRTSTGQVTLLAPFETDSTRWADLDWWPLDGSLEPHRIETQTGLLLGPPDTPRTPDGRIRAVVRSYRQVIDDFAHHPEAKSQDSVGRADRHSTGLLARRTVRPSTRSLIGKEGHRIEEQTAGLISTDAGIATVYARDPDAGVFDIVRDILIQFTVDEILTLTPANATVTRGQLNRFLSGRRRTLTGVSADVMMFVAATLAADALCDARLAELASYRPRDVLYAWKRSPVLRERLCACGCQQSVTAPRSRYATSACRVRAHRAKQANN